MKTGLHDKTRTVLLVGLWLSLPGCQAPPAKTPDDLFTRQKQQFVDIDAPRKIGVVENIGLQLPQVSPDGRRMLYLRTDQAFVSPMTLFGSTDPIYTPTNGTLTVWLRETTGSLAGKRISSARWAHSPVWSPTGQTFAYIEHAPNHTNVVHVNPATGQETRLGRDEAINCLPRFDGDDDTLLFCAGADPRGPFRIYRQHVADPAPKPLSPDNTDCVLPIRSDFGESTLCLKTDATGVIWAQASPDGVRPMSSPYEVPNRVGLVRFTAGITEPLAPDGKRLLYFNPARETITVWQIGLGEVQPPLPNSMAACWLDADTLALANAEVLLLVSAHTPGILTSLNGAWIPCRYVPEARRLILLGKHSDRRLAVWEMKFKTRATDPVTTAE